MRATDTLVSLNSWWLSVRCACGVHTYLPFRWLSARYGWETQVGAILTKLKCKRCGARPERVEVVNDPAKRADQGLRVMGIISCE